MATLGKTLPQTAVLPVRSLIRKEGALKLRGEVLLALDTLRKNPLRSALTILGIVIGITTVITVSAMINGLNDNVLAGIRELGYDTASLLFPESVADSIGKEVTINGQLFSVIGTCEKRKQGISGGSNPEDNIAMMPVTTLRKLYPDQKDYVIFAKASDPAQVGQAVEEMRDLLRRKRRLSNDKPDDFALFTSDYFLDLWNKISGLIFILMFAVASVGLIVGGIGVMNIMLVSVTERTREIGVRKAIGAKRGNILSQFLIEAVTLSAVGGVIGVLFGSGLSLVIRY